MRRFAHCLILLLAPTSLAWAEDSFEKSQRGACVYSSETTNTVAPGPSRAAKSNSTPVATTAQRSVAPPSPAAETGGGGGGSEDDLMQRMRAPRWHSFLPGMFR